MDPLNVTTQAINLLDYKELERFAREAYKLGDYKFAAVEVCENDSDHAFHVSTLDADALLDDEEDVKLIRSGHVPLFRNGLLLDLLCTDGLLPAGNYVVQVVD